MIFTLRLFFVALTVSAAGAQAATLTVQVSDAQGKPLADVVVVADAADGQPAPPPRHGIEIEQRGLKFQPLVSVIQTGTRIAFPNNDRVRHHIYSFSPAKKFDQKLYSGAAAAVQLFDMAGTVVLGCNIHDRMVAYIKVVDSPLFAKTDASGTATIALPAAGKYAVTAWHYNMSGPDAVQNVTLSDGGKPLVFRLALKPPVLDPEAGEGG